MKSLFKLSKREIKNILVLRKHNQLGDILVSVPMYYALKKHFPESKITLIVSKTNYTIPFNEINPFVDDVIIYDKSTIKNQINLIKYLRSKSFQLGIVPATIRLSAVANIINFITGCKYRVGIRKLENELNAFSFLLNIKKDFNWISNKTHQILRNLEVIEQINCKISLADALNSIRLIKENDIKWAKEYLKSFNLYKQKFLIGFHPGAGQKENIWNTENFIEVAKILHQKWNTAFLITAGKIDQPIVKKITNSLLENNLKFIVVEHQPISKLASLINECDVFISNDTGVMHVAGLTDTFLISLFRKLKAYEWAPMGKNKFYIETPHNDINTIKANQVYELCANLLRLKSYGKNKFE